ncbi:MAG: carboxypeptidase-like regulatory domain-containing protein [Gemmatimonadetes bacterium]|nr:carboxypeptidase-like regulatory domain-containing protein [Gemmatimonadota bacterium]
MPRSTLFVEGPHQRESGRYRAGAQTIFPLILAALLGMVLAAPGAAQESGSIGGVVVEQQSLRPLAGVQVSVERSGRGTITDSNGRFLITGVTAGEVTLRAQAIGYATATRTASVGDTNVQIALAQQAVALDEVVVTGTAGDSRQRALGNAVAQIRAAEVVERTPINNVQELINGRAPGVVITAPSGQVGGGSRIRIRGLSTLSLSGQPLLYVDGVRVDNAATSGPPTGSPSA